LPNVLDGEAITPSGARWSAGSRGHAAGGRTATRTTISPERNEMTDNAPKVLLRSEDSGGHVAIVALTGGGRPPLHRHDFDEAFYVLEGELTFQLGDDLFTRSAGELAFAPRGIAHTYANLSGAPARALLVITPAGFERYFDRIASQVTGSEPPAEAAKPIPEVVTIGPPLGG
jgi:quercetin dioxygenase-like cupin family protein